MAQIKITQLSDIGSNIAVTTLVPIVNMSSVTTQKATVGNLANVILGQSGGNYVAANRANLAYSVVNAAQPNITSVGTLTSLTVSGNVDLGDLVLTTLNVSGEANLGDIGNITIDGGNSGEVLTTDGAGNLSWSSVAATGNISTINLDGNASNVLHGDGTWSADATDYSNANVGAYLEVYTGNINAGYIVASSDVNANVIFAAYLYGEGSNISGSVPNADNANNVSVANVSGIGNIATLNLDGNVSNVLAGDGTWIAAGGNANTGNITFNGSNISTDIANANIDINGNGPDGHVIITANGYGWTFEPYGNFGIPDGTVLGSFNANNATGFNVQGNGQFQIRTQDGTTNDWFFTQDGELLTPGAIIPDANITYDLGNSTNRWKDIYLANSTIYLGDATISANGNNVVMSNISANGKLSGDYVEFLDGGVATESYISESSFIVGSNNSMTLATLQEQNVSIITGFDGNATTWIFDTTGNLTFPDTTVQTTAYPGFDQDLNTTDNVAFNITTVGGLLTEFGYIGVASGDFLVLSPSDGNTFIQLPTTANEDSNEVLIAHENTSNGVVKIKAGSKIWSFDADGNLTLAGNLNTNNIVGNANADMAIVTGGYDLSFDVDIANGKYAVVNGDGDFYVTGNITSNGIFNGDGSGLSNIASANISGLGNISSVNLDGNVSNVLAGNGTWIAIGGSSYGDGNVVTLLGSFGSNTVDTTGDISAGNLISVGEANTYSLYVGAGGANINGNVIINGDISNVEYILANANISTNNNFISLANVYAVDGIFTGDISANNLGNISSIDLDGNVSNVLAGDGTWIAAGSGGTYGDSNVASLLSAFGSNTITTTGNVSVGNIIGNGQALSNISGSNVTGTVANAFYATSAGTATTATSATSATTAATITTAAQPNITSVGTLTSLSVSGNVSSGNLSITGNITGNTNGYTIGYLDIPQISFVGNTTLSVTDSGKHYYATLGGGTYSLTIPDNANAAFPLGTAINIVVGSAGNLEILTQGGVSLYLAGNSSAGNRTISNWGMATLLKVETNKWFINGTGVS